jgi:glutamate-1-semialdehyde 2,1-aminomutase
MHPADNAFDYGHAYRERALKSVAFGVSSTPRGRQLPAPIVVRRAEQAHVFDETGTRFVDYALGYGPLILGHSPSCVIEAIQNSVQLGLRTASVHGGEAELGELIADTLPCAEQSAFVSSGSEAVHLALRTARAATGKLPIIKFRGNYHGWFDNIHIANDVQNDGAATIGQNPDAAANVTILDWGDIAGFEATISSDFAAVILEPVAVNGGCLYPPDGFLEAVRRKTAEHGVVLIFDEVITGYRLSLGGAQQVMGVCPDIAVIGKAMGSGMPIGAIAGTKAIMEPIASGRMLHRGTFNGNPISLAASIACINHLRNHAPALFDHIDEMAAELEAHAEECARASGVEASITRVGSALQIFLGLPRIERLADTANIDKRMTARFAEELLKHNVQIIARGLMYLSSAHTRQDIDLTKDAIAQAFAALEK